jgi:hypothetical protein
VVKFRALQTVAKNCLVWHRIRCFIAFDVIVEKGCPAF